MENFDEIVIPTRDELLAQLPTYQMESLIPILADFEDDPMQAIDKWLDSESISVAQFGETGETRSFSEAVKRELSKFLCGDKAYKKERDAILKKGNLAQTLTVSSITMAIAPAVGAAAPVVAASIVLILLGAAKISIRAWCEVNNA